jgi:DNA-binding CsgD family transcriptional regulator
MQSRGDPSALDPNMRSSNMGTREDIERLLNHGFSHAETARRLGLAGPTVAYHVGRQRQATDQLRNSRSPDVGSPTAVRRTVDTRERVAQLLAEGHSRGEIARRLDVSKSTVSYHARRLGLPVDARGARRYDWGVVQRYHDEGHSVRACQERFGFSRQTWWAAAKRGAIVPRPHLLPLERLLAVGVHRARRNLKARLIRAGVKQAACEECGIVEWRGRTLSLALHHVNGDREDNRIENLSLLCPNCHSQTSNFAGRANRPSAAA